MTRHPETMQSRVEREVAEGNLRSARRLQAIPTRTPIQEVAYRDAVTTYMFRRRVARAMRAPSQTHAQRTVWAPLAKGGAL
ncbi:MAG: hypothetical protein AB7T63_17945 [Planctomycetota bacterium]